MKYIVIYVYDSGDPSGMTNGILPGAMFEVDRTDTLEQANKVAQAFNPHGGHLLILPYYETEQL